MKTIITAIANPELAKQIKEEKDLKTIGKDIQYKEGILEILEKNKKVDYIILKENIDGKIELKNLINKIIEINKKIKLIILTKEKERNEGNTIYINYIDKIDTLKIINTINRKQNINIDLLNKQNPSKEKKQTIKLNKKDFIEKIRNKNNNFSNIILITGKPKSGKSTITIALGNQLNKLNNKVLLVDFELKNEKLNYLLKCKKFPYQIRNILIKEKQKNKASYYFYFMNNVIKNISKNNKRNNKKNYNHLFNYNLRKNKNNNIIINNKILQKLVKKNNTDLIIDENIKFKKILTQINEKYYLLSGLSFIFSPFNFKSKNYYQNKEKLILLIKKLSKFFDYILIDYPITEELFFEKEASKIIYILEPNLLGIKELNKLMISNKKWKFMDNESLHILINKKEINSIDTRIIKKIFSKLKFLGIIKKQNEKS